MQMRPKSVERFELLYLVSLGFAYFRAGLESETLTQSVGITAALIVAPLIVLVPIGLVLLVSRLGSNILRWVFLVFFVISVVFYILNIPELPSLNPFDAVMYTFELLFGGSAIYFVFRPDAKPWFQETSA
jgi:hypothetical protein